MKFYLGTHEITWLSQTSVPLFISEKRLEKRKGLPESVGSWALDSGGFSQLSMYSSWPKGSDKVYVEHIKRYQNEIGNLEWVAPQDWMCEPFMVAKTGLTVYQHQLKTVQNFMDLKSLDGGIPFIPVIQGYSLSDYLRCINIYTRYRICLIGKVGIGSICRRQGTNEALTIIQEIRRKLPYAKLHIFGAKITGLNKFKNLIDSSDSMAWSFAARRDVPLMGHTHKNCANCLEYALNWYYSITGEQKRVIYAVR